MTSIPEQAPDEPYLHFEQRLRNWREQAGCSPPVSAQRRLARLPYASPRTEPPEPILDCPATTRPLVAAPGSMFPFKDVWSVFGFKTQKELRHFLNKRGIPVSNVDPATGKSHGRRCWVNALAVAKAIKADESLSDDPIRMARIRSKLQRHEIDQRLAVEASKFLGFNKP